MIISISIFRILEIGNGKLEMGKWENGKLEMGSEFI